MPEGHTVHRDARRVRERFGGREVRVSSPQGRFADGAALLDGRRLEGTEAHGKHLLADFGAGRVLHVHLGLYGAWTVGDGQAPPPRGAVRVRLQGEGGWSDLRGPTACEVLDPAGVAALHARLGPDPLRADADPERAYERISRSRTSIGALLMQQDVVAGVGAIYRAEVLFRTGVNPYRPGREVSPADWRALWADLLVLLRAGLRAGRIVTTRPEHRTRPRGRPTVDDVFYVYRRAGLPCRVCGTPVAYAQMVSRHLAWCPTCQPR
ncbi:Fpg/Nei family DNA glycosylase [Kineococcus sp. T13]|uniref:Fpg/Nei family DNA glycosylase n=1 Tax=Kineococcus vitellinus TaxID=2696565 RepID=UPI0014128652|nr:Fpg/Nei family DNA glycosylase [Kineococcus vitellinus]NAZ75423.1 Fpg/Nei family DNA glycosylase [Kineococcus vitellinus]